MAVITPTFNTSSDLTQAVIEAHDSVLEQSRQIQRLAQFIDEQFKLAVNAIHNCKGRLIISGMGKSGLIGKKIAATMASTGTSSFYVHPGEAFHGDLGMIRPEDIVLLITNSGETDEVIKLIPSLKNFGNTIIGMTGKMDSTLAQYADITLNVSVEREVCPNNLAPTASTTATLVMGDALAVALIHMSDFKPMDFAMFHPGGSLGRKLLTKVKDVMVKNDLPFVKPDDTMHSVIMTMTNSRLGLAMVMQDDVLIGVITDGDLRRALAEGVDLKVATAKQTMSLAPITIQEDAMVADGEEQMRSAHIKQIIVKNSEDCVTGVLEFFQ
ncbi:MAG: KpsF/GutQ family sugar-phosphate isomerase [Gammaproteobacteria bacterium]|nr:KpsF/GutQ family sugar-phosphate isomerase [Gammaproteobacteria bacterium]